MEFIIVTLIFTFGIAVGVWLGSRVYLVRIEALQKILDSVKKHRDYLLSEIDKLEEDRNG